MRDAPAKMGRASCPAATPVRVRLGDIAPDMMRLDAEVKQITHAIRMAAYNAETTLARNLAGCEQLTAARTPYPGTDLILRYEVKPHPGTA